MRALLLLGTALVASATAASAQTKGADEVLTRAIQAQGRGECGNARPLIEPWLAAHASEAGPEQLVKAYEIAADCRLINGEYDPAYAYALAGTAFPGAPDWLWKFRLGYELENKHHAEAVTTIEAMAKGNRDALATINIQWFYTFDRELKDSNQPALRRRLLRAILESGYVPTDPIMSLDFFRQHYAETQLDEGDIAGATQTVRGITLRWVLIDLSLDPRFRAMLAPDFDLRAATERNLAEGRAVMAANPELLSPVIEVAGMLRQLGRPQESLALLEAARARVAGKGMPFTDAGETTNWWWDAVARAHAMLGHVDQAVEAFSMGAAQGEGDGANVSQIINLAHAQNRAGRPRDALETLARLDTDSKASLYGFGEMRLARGCANALVGNNAAAAEDLAYLRDHAKDHPSALTSLLLCMRDLDGAAAAMIARLDDPARRTRALVELSDYDAPPVTLPPDPMTALLPALKARADVQAAIARAGGTRRFHIQPDEL